LIEHLTAQKAAQVIRECHRLLRVEGVLRVSTPDFGRYAVSYASDKNFIDTNRPGRPTPLLAIAEVAYGHGHRSIWDAETLIRLMEEIGFADVAAFEPGISRISPAPDQGHRFAESVYVEAIKPRTG
jgi:predicted SAM-dependent methyltransferase